LSKCLAQERQRLPIDIPQPDQATIGGVVAAGAAGPRRYAYGTIRDYLLGFTAIDGTGAIFSGGGRVVKSAAGYNMCRLMAGSHGTLGILTQVTLMVRPQCEASVLFVCDVPDFEVAENLLAGLVVSPTRPAAIEFVAGRPDEGNGVLGPVLAGNIGRLYVGFEGPVAEVDWMVEQLRSQWADAGATEPMLIPTTRAGSLWQCLTDFAADLHVNVLPSDVVGTIAKILEIEPDCAIHAHAGDGVIRVQWKGERREEGGEGRAAVLNGVTQIAGNTEGPTSPKHRVMQAIKDRFDPENILNPGQFVYD
jgi:glycolate oxidase FAD binding subunit